MAKNIRLAGVKKVMNNLNREIAKIEKRSMKGLIEAAILIRRDMDHTPPVIPVDLGNLRASSFITTATMIDSQGSFKGKNAGKMSADHKGVISQMQSKARANPFPVVGIGFSANYAEPVHERKGKISWNRTNSGPRFFEKALKRNEKMIVEIIRMNAKIK